MTTSNDELHRDMGRMEGGLTALEKRLEKMEQILERMDKRMATLEADRQQRKGAMAVLMTVSGVIGGLITKFGAAIFGSH